MRDSLVSMFVFEKRLTNSTFLFVITMVYFLCAHNSYSIDSHDCTASTSIIVYYILRLIIVSTTVLIHFCWIQTTILEDWQTYLTKWKTKNNVRVRQANCFTLMKSELRFSWTMFFNSFYNKILYYLHIPRKIWFHYNAVKNIIMYARNSLNRIDPIETFTRNSLNAEGSRILIFSINEDSP